MSRVQLLLQENAAIRAKIDQYSGKEGLSGQLKEHIEKFVEESKKNIAEINAKIASEQNTLNSQLHTQTSAYETILKRQIQLLNENKILTQKKEQQDALFNSNIEQLTNEYEAQIKEFEQKVKANVKRIQDLSGGNIINRLLKNDKFRSAMQARGCSLQSLEKQSELEEVSKLVEEREVEIGESEARSQQLDDELSKMHELIDTMKELMDNMMKEKENIVKQNDILKEKLKQSQDLINRLLGAQGVDPQGEDEGGEGEEGGEGQEGDEQQQNSEAKQEVSQVPNAPSN